MRVIQRGCYGVLVVGALLLLAGCAITPRSSFTFASDFRAETWTTIAVLPFGGTPAYSRTSAEYFAFRLRSQPHFKIIGPATVEMTARRGGISLRPDGADLPTSEAIRIAAQAGASAVFLGTVTVSLPAQPVAVVEVQLVEASTLHVVATNKE